MGFLESLVTMYTFTQILYGVIILCLVVLMLSATAVVFTACVAKIQDIVECRNLDTTNRSKYDWR